MDMRMPELDGHESTKRLKANAAMQHIPVIAVTASSFREEEARARKICDGFIRKPFNRAELVAELSRFLKPAAEGQTQPATPGQSTLAGEPAIVDFWMSFTRSQTANCGIRCCLAVVPVGSRRVRATHIVTEIDQASSRTETLDAPNGRLRLTLTEFPVFLEGSVSQSHQRVSQGDGRVRVGRVSIGAELLGIDGGP